MGADVIIHNAWVASEDSTALQLVASPEEAAKVFNLTMPGLAVISHYNKEEGLYSRIQSKYKGPILIGKDLQRNTLNKKGHLILNSEY